MNLAYCMLNLFNIFNTILAQPEDEEDNTTDTENIQIFASNSQKRIVEALQVWVFVCLNQFFILYLKKWKEQAEILISSWKTTYLADFYSQLPIWQ